MHVREFCPNQWAAVENEFTVQLLYSKRLSYRYAKRWCFVKVEGFLKRWKMEILRGESSLLYSRSRRSLERPIENSPERSIKAKQGMNGQKTESSDIETV